MCAGGGQLGSALWAQWGAVAQAAFPVLPFLMVHSSGVLLTTARVLLALLCLPFHRSRDVLGGAGAGIQTAVCFPASQYRNGAVLHIRGALYYEKTQAAGSDRCPSLAPVVPGLWLESAL